MRLISVFVLLVSLLAACTSSSNKCVAGKLESCPCSAGTGTQECQADGTFGSCQCFNGTGGGSSAGGGLGNGGGVGAGSGGGSSSGGGSGAGGGIGVTRQEVVSGTRLKALHLAGDDGSDLASISYFYDTQLQLLCAPGFADPSWYYAGGPPQSPRCLPVYMVGEVAANVFCDSSCQTSCGYSFTSGALGANDIVAAAFVVDDFAGVLDGGFESLIKYARLNDGGFLQVSGLSSTTETLYERRPDGGCISYGSTGTGFHAATSTPVPASTFVQFSKHHD